MEQNYLEVHGLRKKFGNTEVLRGIDFSLGRGEILSLIGSSGSGKTTLLRCLNFLEYADAGQILVDGELLFDGEGMKLQKMRDEELLKKRRRFGLVFQSFNLFPQYNVLDNVMLAPKLQKLGTVQEIEEKAKRLISEVGLSDKLKNYPCQLSGGQQQRVAIARALCMDPDILCFDEPTSALDPELTGEVLRVIRGLKSFDRTMIIVTHEMEFARSVSDHVIHMADGMIEEMGTSEEVFGHPKSPKTAAFLSNIFRK